MGVVQISLCRRGDTVDIHRPELILGDVFEKHKQLADKITQALLFLRKPVSTRD